VHETYITAGSNIVLTNSFGGTRHRLKLHKLEERCAELNRAAAALARQVVDEHMAAGGAPVAVAGSIGPTGELFEPLGALTPETAEAAFAEQALALADGGADVLWVETMSSREEMAAAVAAATQTGLPVVATMTFDTNGKTMMGVDPADMPAFAAGLPNAPTAIGANCGVGPAELLHSLIAIASTSAPNAILVGKGNCGVPKFEDGHIHYNGSPETMAEYACLARDVGARIIGGCCGSTASHIQAMAVALREVPKGAPLTHERLAETLGTPWLRDDQAGDTAPPRRRERGSRRRRGR
jgi:5-methyltetrahydrofolate--homocysteine methyltransferase